MRYSNLDGHTWELPLRALWRWQIIDRLLGRRRKRDGPARLPAVIENDGSLLSKEGPHITWVGHATFLLRLAEHLVITDPVWASWVWGYRRLVPPGVALADVPRIDVVTISHNHYDHFDRGTLRRIHHAFDPVFVVPENNGCLLSALGIQKIVELSWWASHREDDLTITLVPAHHWSRRQLFDTNTRLWGGFVFSSPAGVAYHAGDTAFSEFMFQAIHQRVEPIEWAMLPIGAYDPKWFFVDQHMRPEDTGRAFSILGARQLIAMHFGTFDMTDEPVDEPPERLRRWFARAQYPPERLWIPSVGESRRLEKLKTPI